MTILGEGYVAIRPDRSRFEPELRQMVREATERVGREVGGQALQSALGLSRSAAAKDVGRAYGGQFSAGFSDAVTAAGGVLIARRVLQGFTRTIQSAVGFEEAFAGIRKTVDATETQLASLSEELRELAQTIPIPATELARIGEIAGQLGIPAQAIAGFTDTIAKLGVATNLSTEEAAFGVARLSTILQLPITSANALASGIVELGNKVAATEPEILDFSLRIAGAGKTAGLTAGDILGLSAGFARLGVPAERGGTAVQRVLLEIQKAAAAGGAELRKFAEVAGVSPEAFQRQFRTEPIEAFLGVLGGLTRAGEQGAQVLDELGLADARLVGSFLAAAGAGDTVREAVEIANRAVREQSALEVEAQKRFATTAQQLQLNKQRIEELRIEIGGKLAPAALFASRAVADIPGPVLAASGAFAGLTAAGIAFVALQPRLQQINASLNAVTIGAVNLGVAFRALGAAAVAIPVLSALDNAADSLRDTLDRALGRSLDTTELAQAVAKVTEGVVALTAAGGDVNEVLRQAGIEAEQFFSGVEKFGGFLDDVLDFIPVVGSSFTEDVREQLEVLDQALARLATTDGPAAERAFERINTVLKLTPKETVDFFDDFSKALAESSTQGQIAAFSASQADQAVRSLGAGAGGAADQVDGLSGALSSSAKAAQGLVTRFGAVSEDFNTRLGAFLPAFGTTFEQASDRAGKATRQLGDVQQDTARRIADARRSIVEAQEDSAQRIADSERALANAQIDALRRVEEARRALSSSREDARRRFRDAQLRLEDAQVALSAAGSEATPADLQRVRDAQIAVADARADARRRESEGTRSLLETQQESQKRIQDAIRARARAEEEATERIADARRKLVDVERDAAQKIIRSQDAVGSAARKAAGISELSVRAFRDGLAKNTADLKTFESSLRTIAKRVQGVGREDLVEPFLAELAELGPKAAPFLRRLANTSDTELSKVKDAFDRQVAAAKRAMDLQFDRFPPNLHQKMEAIRAQLQKDLQNQIAEFRAFGEPVGELGDLFAAQLDQIAGELLALANTGKISLDAVSRALLESGEATKDPIRKTELYEQALKRLGRIEAKPDLDLDTRRFERALKQVGGNIRLAVLELNANLPTFHSGGVVPGVSGGPPVPALLLPRETVRTEEQERALQQGHRSVEQNITVNQVREDPEATARVVSRALAEDAFR